nr:glycosyltransferase [Nanoarchaeota archaeon]
MKKVSFIIPAYNAEKTIKDTLEFVLAQKCNKEIIVVDNNSKDKTRDIVKKYNKVKLLIEKKEGCGAARNKGMRYAKGGYIAFIDADVILPKKWVKIALKKLKKHKVAGVGGPCKSPNKDIVSQSLNLLLYGRKISKKDRLINSVAAAAALYNRKMIEGVKSDERLLRGQDLEFNFRLREKEYTLLHSPQLSVLHIHPVSLKSLIKKWYKYGQYYPLPYLMHPKFIRKYFIFRHLFISVFLALIILSIFRLSFLFLIILQILFLYAVYFCLGLRNLKKLKGVFLIKFSFIHTVK